MKNLDIIFNDFIYVNYGQLSLLNAEYDENLSEPVWKRGDGYIVFAQAGVLVLTQNDQNICTTVQKTEVDVENFLLGKGHINLTTGEFVVGNVITNDFKILKFKKGKVEVKVFANDQSGNATKVNFVLK